MHDSGPLSGEAEATWNGMLEDEGSEVSRRSRRGLISRRKDGLPGAKRCGHVRLWPRNASRYSSSPRTPARGAALSAAATVELLPASRGASAAAQETKKRTSLDIQVPAGFGHVASSAPPDPSTSHASHVPERDEGARAWEQVSR